MAADPNLTTQSIRSVRQPFFLLDGLRGLAAVMVLAYHAHDLFSARLWFPSTYLAVDVFFDLSGYVLAFAYDRRLEEGLGWQRFMRIRLARLYPAYLLALVIGVAAMAVALMGGSRIVASFGALAWSTAFGALLLPTPAVLSEQDALYATNPAAWSIFYELVVNLVFALAFRRIRGRALAAVIVVSAIALAVVASAHGTVDAGAGWPTASSGLARVFLSFFIGVSLYRARRRGRFWLTMPWWAPCALMLASFCVHFDGPASVVYEGFCIAVLYPFLICVAADATTSSRVNRICLQGGALSYPVYILHTPLLFLLTGVMVRVADAPVAALRPWGGWLVVTLIVLLSSALHRWVEQPALLYFRQRAAARA